MPENELGTFQKLVRDLTEVTPTGYNNLYGGSVTCKGREMVTLKLVQLTYPKETYNPPRYIYMTPEHFFPEEARVIVSFKKQNVQSVMNDFCTRADCGKYGSNCAMRRPLRT